MANREVSRPLDEQQARVNVEELAAYHATHRFRYPGCLCPILYPEAIGTDNETVLFLASHGEYEGRLVVACARGDCGYLGMYRTLEFKGR